MLNSIDGAYIVVHSLVCFCAITGQEYSAIVEFAPFQKIAKKRSKKRDAKCGTIDDGEVMVDSRHVAE